jgi:alcohol dehydrogenase class IV
MSPGIALEGMRLALENLPKVYQDGADLAARAHMMSAAAMGAVAFQKGLGAIHSLSHPVGAHYNTHHGTTNAVVMPAVLRFNRPAIEGRIEAAAAYLGVEGGFDGFLDTVIALRAALGVPDTLADLGVPREGIEALAPEAVADPTAGTNPVKFDADEAAALYRACFEPNS